MKCIRIKTIEGELLRIDGKKAELKDIQTEHLNDRQKKILERLNGKSAEDALDILIATSNEIEPHHTIQEWCRQAVDEGIMAYVEVE